MAVTVEEILHFEKMHDAVLLAGSGGLKKEVKRVATIEKPYVDHMDYSNQVAQPGDLYLSKLHVFNDEKSKFYEEIEFMRRTKSSGLITHKNMTDFIDLHAIDLANQYGIPIIAINEAYGLTELTYSIIDLVLRDKMAKVTEGYINRMLHSEISGTEIRKSLLQMTPEMKDIVMAVFLRSSEYINLRIFTVEKEDLIMPLYGGALYLMSFEDENIGNRADRFLHKAATSLSHYQAGVSELHKGLEHSKQAIFEAIYSSVYACYTNRTHCHYDDLGEYALLLETRNTKLLEKCWERFFLPITRYKNEDEMELLPVLKLFIQSNGDYKYVAKQLYIHETTVRFRLNKIRNIVGINNMYTFFSEARAALFAESILNDTVLKKL